MHSNMFIMVLLKIEGNVNVNKKERSGYVNSGTKQTTSFTKTCVKTEKY